MAWIKSQADVAKAQAILKKYPDLRQLPDGDRVALARLQQEVNAWVKPQGGEHRPEGGLYLAPRHPGDPVSKQEARGPISTAPITSNDASIGEHIVAGGKSLLSAVGVPTSMEEIKRPFKPGKLDIKGTNRYVPLPPPMFMPPGVDQTIQAATAASESAGRAKKAKGVEKVGRYAAAALPMIGPLAEGAADQMTPAIAKSMLNEQSTKEEQLALTSGGTQAIGALATMHPAVQRVVAKTANKVAKSRATSKLKSVTRKMSPQGPASKLAGTLEEFLPSEGMKTRIARGEDIANMSIDEYGGKLPTEELNTARLKEYTEARQKHIESSSAVIPENKSLDAMLKDVTSKVAEEVGGSVSAAPSALGQELLGILENAKQEGWTAQAYNRVREIGSGPPPQVKEAAQQAKRGAGAAARKAQASANNAKSATQKLMELEAEIQQVPDTSLTPEQFKTRTAKLEKARQSAAKAQQVAQDAANFAEESSLAYQEAAAALEQHQQVALPKKLQEAVQFVENTRRLNNGTLELTASAADATKRRATAQVTESGFNKEPTDADKSRNEFYRSMGSGLRRAVIEAVNETGATAAPEKVKFKRPGETDTEFLHRRVAELQGMKEILKNKRVASAIDKPLNQTTLAATGGAGPQGYFRAGIGGGAAGAIIGGAAAGPVGVGLGALAGLPIGAALARAQKTLWTSPEVNQYIANIRREGMFGEPNSVWYRRQVEAMPPPVTPPRSPKGGVGGGINLAIERSYAERPKKYDKAGSGSGGSSSSTKATQYNNQTGGNIPAAGKVVQKQATAPPSAPVRTPKAQSGFAKETEPVPAKYAERLAANKKRMEEMQSIKARKGEEGLTIGEIIERRAKEPAPAAATPKPAPEKVEKVEEKAPEPVKPAPTKAAPPPVESKPASASEENPVLEKLTAKQEDKALRMAGYTNEQIAEMSPEQVKSEIKKALGKQISDTLNELRPEEMLRLMKARAAKKASAPEKVAAPPPTTVPKPKEPTVEAPVAAKGIANLTPEQRTEKLATYRDELARAKKNRMQGDQSRIDWLQKRISDIEDLQKGAQQATQPLDHEAQYDIAQKRIDEFETRLEAKGVNPIKLYRKTSRVAGVPEPAGWKPMPEELEKLYEARDAVDQEAMTLTANELSSKLSKFIVEDEKRNALARDLVEADVPTALRSEFSETDTANKVARGVNKIMQYISQHITKDTEQTAFTVSGRHDSPDTMRLVVQSESGLGPSQKTLNETQRWLDHIFGEDAPKVPGAQKALPPSKEKK